MKGFDTLHVKSAVKSRSSEDISFTHLTTMDFGQIGALAAIETIPGAQYPIQGDFFCRTAPLVKPTYGKFSFKTVVAFVPYHQVAYDAEAWLSGKTTWEGATPVQRYFTVRELAQFILTYCCTSTGASSTNYDYVYISSTGVTLYALFTPVGRYYIKVLNQLGYALPQDVDLQTSGIWYTSVSQKKLSAYPFLAFFKLYNDYMSQSQRFNSSVLTDTLRKIKYNETISSIYSNGALNRDCIKSFFDWLFLNYENDYFTSAWQQPNNAINSIENISTALVPQNASGPNLGSVNQNVNDNVLTHPVVSSVVYLSQRALDFLRSFDLWVKRNNYSGSRSVQQIYSRFGIKSEDYKSHYAHVYDTDSMPVQVGDVTATAQDPNVPLGDYAGKAIMTGNKSVNIEVSDFGLLLVLGYFTVSPMTAYGYDKKVLRSDPLDYYTPEFDGIGAEAISVGEVWTSPRVTGETVKDNAVFGFTERYNSYRFGRDQITGDFRDYRSNGDMNVWHTGRNLEAIRTAGNLVAQSSSMNTLPQVNSEYNRIFSVTAGTVDHFYLTCRFTIKATLPIKNLNEVTGLGVGDTVVPRNGNVIS